MCESGPVGIDCSSTPCQVGLQVRGQIVYMPAAVNSCATRVNLKYCPIKALSRDATTGNAV
jgi:hypothetical protein